MFLHILHTVDFIEIVLIIFGFWFFEWHTHFVGGGPNAFNPFHISGFSLSECNIQTNKCKFLVNVVFKMRKSFQWTKLSAVGCHQFRGHQHHFWPFVSSRNGSENEEKICENYFADFRYDRMCASV